jgi:hypothetical protein
MKLKNRILWTSVNVLMVVMVSALQVIPAYADEPAPPEEQPVSVETLPIEEILSEVPEGTEVVILDENGQSVPLATQAAAQAIAEHDPIWCPAGVAPKPGMGGCSTSYANLSSLVAAGPHNANGVIWIEKGTDTGAEVEIDGAGSWASAKNFSLTLQGGWIGGLTGSKAITGVTVFDTGISIVNWNGNVTVKDIAMVNATNTLNPATGALYVQTTKNIVLTNVTASGTTGASNNGAYLDNASSTTQASITIKNSSFNENQQRGLYASSSGAITLTNVTANRNNIDRGAYLLNVGDSVASLVTVTGSNFLSNAAEGLYIYSNGAVKLTNVTTSGNVGDGVHIDNKPASIAAPVTVSGFYTAEMNGGNGITVESDGAITLSNISAIFNSDNGAYVTNNSAATSMAVTLTGNNQFLNNGFDGLFINTKGPVTTNNITANDNGYDLNDDGDYGVYISSVGATPKPVILKGTNVFNGNDGTGLYIADFGNITVSNITANDNDASGTMLFNAFGTQNPIILTGYGTFKSNGVAGLYISSNGSVSTTNLTASLNFGSDGVYINTIGITAPQSVSIKGNNVFTSNGSAAPQSGLRVYSDGNITVNNLNASLNYANGVYLDNKTNWLLGTFPTFGSITMTGTNSFYATATGPGLYVNTHGKATLSNIHSSFNDNASAGRGVYIAADGNVTLSCIFVNNNHWGLWMNNSVSLLTIKGLYAVDNVINESLLATTINRTSCP